MSELLSWKFLRNPLNLMACGFGTGFVPVAPGTAATLVAVPLVLVTQQFAPALQWVICGVMFAFGCLICGNVAKVSGVSDPQFVVWDEITGFCIAMAALPASAGTLIAAFVIFRALDILKPFPIAWIEQRVSGGFGIMVDDVVAGIATNLILIILLKFTAP